MSYQIPTHFVEQIIKNFSGSVIININKEINYLFGSDVKCPDFYKNAKIQKNKGFLFNTNPLTI